MSETSAGVAFEYERQKYISLRVDPDEIPYQEQLVYETTDCSGTGYWDSVPPGPLFEIRPAVVLPPGKTLYLIDRDTVATIVVHSIYFQPLGCYAADDGPVVANPARVLVDLDTLFVPPFHLVDASRGSTTGN